MESNEKSPKDNFKNAICYIPFVAVLLYFVEQNKTITLDRSIRYGIYLLVLYIIISFIFNLILFFLPISFILFIIYILISLYYGYRAYNGEENRIEFLDKLDEKINSKKQ